ncbi:MAG: helix-turn-helix transcriptional regulator [Ruminococcus sp.]|nr:helix-turn-helix transcriptional regulator [Ruminococcus sp.]
MNNIKKFRKEKRLTLKELGAMCDISESAMQRIESGARNPSFEVLLKLTDALGHSSDEIMGEEKKQDTNFPQVTMIGRAAQKMSEEKREQMLQLLKIAFPEEFEE